MINPNETNKEKLSKEFDKLPSIKIDELKGMYKGGYWKTGSLFGFILKITNWEGKEFINKNKVNALVHKFGSKQIKLIFGKSKLEEKVYNNKKSTSMKYKILPIRDHFRKIDKNSLMGAMTIFGFKKPVLFFYLKKK